MAPVIGQSGPSRMRDTERKARHLRTPYDRPTSRFQPGTQSKPNLHEVPQDESQNGQFDPYGGYAGLKSLGRKLRSALGSIWSRDITSSPSEGTLSRPTSSQTIPRPRLAHKGIVGERRLGQAHDTESQKCISTNAPISSKIDAIQTPQPLEIHSNKTNGPSLEWCTESGAPPHFDLSLLAANTSAATLPANVIISAYRQALMQREHAEKASSGAPSLSSLLPLNREDLSFPKRGVPWAKDTSAYRPSKQRKLGSDASSVESSNASSSVAGNTTGWGRIRSRRAGLLAPPVSVKETGHRIELVSKPIVDLSSLPDSRKDHPGFISANFDVSDDETGAANPLDHTSDTASTKSSVPAAGASNSLLKRRVVDSDKLARLSDKRTFSLSSHQSSSSSTQNDLKFSFAASGSNGTNTSGPSAPLQNGASTLSTGDSHLVPNLSSTKAIDQPTEPSNPTNSGKSVEKPSARPTFGFGATTSVFGASEKAGADTTNMPPPVFATSSFNKLTSDGSGSAKGESMRSISESDPKPVVTFETSSQKLNPFKFGNPSSEASSTPNSDNAKSESIQTNSGFNFGSTTALNPKINGNVGGPDSATLRLGESIKPRVREKEAKNIEPPENSKPATGLTFGASLSQATKPQTTEAAAAKLPAFSFNTAKPGSGMGPFGDKTSLGTSAQLNSANADNKTSQASGTVGSIESAPKTNLAFSFTPANPGAPSGKFTFGQSSINKDNTITSNANTSTWGHTGTAIPADSGVKPATDETHKQGQGNPTDGGQSQLFGQDAISKGGNSGASGFKFGSQSSLTSNSTFSFGNSKPGTTTATGTVANPAAPTFGSTSVTPSANFGPNSGFRFGSNPPNSGQSSGFGLTQAAIGAGAGASAGLQMPKQPTPSGDIGQQPLFGANSAAFSRSATPNSLGFGAPILPANDAKNSIGIPTTPVEAFSSTPNLAFGQNQPPLSIANRPIAKPRRRRRI